MIDNQKFKQTMARFASGITILTWYEHNNIQGITVSAFSSLSLQPPLVLFCIAHGAYVHPQLVERDMVGINILAAQQTNLAYQFAGADRTHLEQHTYEHDVHSIPLINHAHANIIARITDRHRQGDHDIFIAEILDVHLPEQSQPLLYHGGQIFHLNNHTD